MNLKALKTVLAALAALAFLGLGIITASAQQGAPQVANVWTSVNRLASAISVTNSSAATALPIGGNVVWVCNIGAANDAYVALGASTVTVTATTGSWVKASTCSPLWRASVTGGLATHIATITASSTTSLAIETGIGTPPAGLTGGGGGGGSVTQGTDPWIVAGGGTAGTAALGVVTVQGIASMVPFLTTSTLNQGAAALSVTNGLFTNILQGNAILSTTNPLFLTGTGTAGTAAVNPITVQGIASMTPLLANATLAAETTKVIGTVNQGTSPWIISGAVTGTFWQATQPVSLATAPTTPVTGTFWQATQPVSGTFWQATQPVSIASMPSTPVTGTFWQATQPVSIASLPSVAVTNAGTFAVQVNGFTSWAGGALGAMANLGTSPGSVLVPGANSAICDATNCATIVPASTPPSATNKSVSVSINPESVNANGQATMANSSPVVLSSNQTVADPCMFAAKTNVPISITGTTTTKLVSLVASQKIYICSLSLITAGATIVNVFDGLVSTTECNTAQEAIIGAGAAAGVGGMSLVANGGLTLGNGGATAALTNTAAHDLCISQSGAGVIAGHITYVQRVP